MWKVIDGLVLCLVLLYALAIFYGEPNTNASTCIGGIVYEVVDGEIVAQLDPDGGLVLCQEWDDE